MRLQAAVLLVGDRLLRLGGDGRVVRLDGEVVLSELPETLERLDDLADAIVDGEQALGALGASL